MTRAIAAIAVALFVVSVAVFVATSASARPGDRRYAGAVTGVSVASDTGVHDDAAASDTGAHNDAAPTDPDASLEGYVGLQAVGFGAVGF